MKLGPVEARGGIFSSRAAMAPFGVRVWRLEVARALAEIYIVAAPIRSGWVPFFQFSDASDGMRSVGAKDSSCLKAQSMRQRNMTIYRRNPPGGQR